MTRTLPIIALAILTATTSTQASDQPEQEALPWHVIFQWDNDLLTGTDDGYTNGNRIAFTRALSTDSAQHSFLQRTLHTLTGAGQDGLLNNLRFPEADALRFQYGIGLSQLMFTPEDPNTLTSPNGERPYAGWIGLEFSLQASADNSSSTATLSIGTTGRYSYAEDTQDWIHEHVSDSPLFQGWDSQAPSELTINLHLDHKRQFGLGEHTEDWPIQFDGFFEWGASLGNFRTDTYLGTLIRAGLHLPASYATPRVQLGSFTDTLFEKDPVDDHDWSLYGFAGVRGYAVLHDITLDGPLTRGWDEDVNSETLVGEASFGLAARYEWLEISLSHTLRTDEFDGQRNLARFGSVLVRLSNDF